MDVSYALYKELNELLPTCSIFFDQYGWNLV